MRGNIPPVLVTHDDAEHERQDVLADRRGHGVATDVLEYLAEPVRVRGSLRRMGDLEIVRLDPTDIDRL